MKNKLIHIKGLFRRWYRKLFRRNMSVVKNGLWYFQEFADIYGDTINDVDSAERFFNDFMKETGGTVILDFLDTSNWDCIRTINVDKQNGLIWFYWQLPHEDPEIDIIRKMVFPCDYHGMCIKLDNVRFIRGRKGKCFGICVNGYTMREKSIKSYAKNDGWDVKGINSEESFFSTSVLRVKDNISQFLQFINTPISSFWIIPKSLNVRPDDSEKFLYQIGVERCENRIKAAFERLYAFEKSNADEQKFLLKSVGNELRNAAENLFKLIMCFYQEEYHFAIKNYDDLRLGDLTGPLKKSVYTSEQQVIWLGDIAKIANDLSHDSGNPVTLMDVGLLYGVLVYFVNDFKSRIARKGKEIKPIKKSNKPDPRDYIKEHFNELCFKDEIDLSLKKPTGHISYTVKAQVGIIMDVFADKEDWTLCEDGYFRNIKKFDDATILKVWDREEVIKIIKEIRQKTRKICESKGYDTEYYTLGLTLDAVLSKEFNPQHLFTEEEIKQLMINADDNKNNKLVIDEDGYARIIQNPFYGYLYPVSQETWFAGNQYVGKDSELTDLHDSYVLCIHLWLKYLETGYRQYDDLYVSDDGLDKIIEEIKKYYYA